MNEQQRYYALLSFLSDPRHEERLPQRNNYAWLSGYYRSLLDDIAKLLGRSELIAYLEARRALFRPRAEGRSDESLNAEGIAQQREIDRLRQQRDQLLEALRNVLPVYARLQRSALQDFSGPSSCAARAAIAKAEGRSDG